MLIEFEARNGTSIATSILLFDQMRLAKDTSHVVPKLNCSTDPSALGLVHPPSRPISVWLCANPTILHRLAATHAADTNAVRIITLLQRVRFRRTWRGRSARCHASCS